MIDNKNYAPIRAVSHELKLKCEEDSVFSDELLNIIIAHENNVIAKRKKTPQRKVFRIDYETSKGKIRINTFFTECGKLKYSYMLYVNKE